MVKWQTKGPLVILGPVALENGTTALVERGQSMIKTCSYLANPQISRGRAARERCDYRLRAAAGRAHDAKWHSIPHRARRLDDYLPQQMRHVHGRAQPPAPLCPARAGDAKLQAECLARAHATFFHDVDCGAVP